MFTMPVSVEIFPSPRLLGAPRLFGSLEYVIWSFVLTHSFNNVMLNSIGNCSFPIRFQSLNFQLQNIEFLKVKPILSVHNAMH